MNAIDLFAGVGWGLAARELGVDELGIDIEPTVKATRDQLGMRTLLADVSQLDPAEFAPCELLAGSPPCPTFSAAGRGGGRHLTEILVRCLGELAAGNDSRAQRREDAFQVLEPVYWRAEQDKARKKRGTPDREKSTEWVMAKSEDRPERKAQGAGNRPRRADQPAATLDSRTDLAEWVAERPATTVAADPRVHPPGHKLNGDDEAAGREYDGRAGKNAVRVTVTEAAILQGFSPDVPWQGSRTAVFRQIGNAIPPPLAKAILSSLLDTLPDEQAEAA